MNEENEKEEKYKSGALWKTRQELFGYDNDDKGVIIPPETYVLLLKYYTDITQKHDMISVFYDKKIVYLEEDVGHVFDLDPSKIENGNKKS